MTISIDHATRQVTVEQSDLTLVSGSLYELDTNQFRLDVGTLMASEEFIYLPDPFSHNTEVTVAGTTFARVIEMINSYDVTFENVSMTVRLAGSNNNLFDAESGILTNQPLVNVIAQNSAGLIVGSGGGAGGFTSTDRDKLDDTYDQARIAAQNVQQ